MGKQSEYKNEQLIKLIQAGIDTQENYLKLYEQNGGFIHNTIKKYIHEPIMEYEDLMQQSYIALTRAVYYYNAELEETNFLGMLKFCIKSSIAELRGTPRGINNLIVKYRKIKRDIEDNTGETPTDEEMMLYMNIGKVQLKSIKTGLLLQSTTSLDTPLSEDTDMTRKDLLIDDTSTDYQQTIEDRELKKIITKALEILSDKQRNIIIERYIRGRTLENIAEELNCSRNYINTIERKALTELRRNKEVVAALEDYIPPPTIYTKRSIDSIVIDSIKREETFKNTHTGNDLQDMLRAAFMAANNQKKIKGRLQRMNELELKIKELNKTLNTARASEILKARNLPPELSDLMATDDDDGTETMRNIDKFSIAFQKTVDKAANEVMTGRKPAAAYQGMTKEEFQKLSLNEQQKLFETDRTLFEKLASRNDEKDYYSMDAEQFKKLGLAERQKIYDLDKKLYMKLAGY